jgi:hypothetical protein
MNFPFKTKKFVDGLKLSHHHVTAGAGAGASATINGSISTIAHPLKSQVLNKTATVI